ncbi:hypothetical protein [Pseudonocardia kujensis]|nr:hypothetical protein [Pseudonocardia kujensis]
MTAPQVPPLRAELRARDARRHDTGTFSQAEGAVAAVELAPRDG